MSIFKKASVLPIARTSVSQGLEPMEEDPFDIPEDNDSRKQFLKMSPKQKALDELDLRIDQVGRYDGDYYKGMAKGFSEAIEILNKYL